MIDLSVIIVNWNTCQMLADCLASLALPEVSQGIRLEIFVLDNASSDGSVDMVRSQHPEVVLLINDENLGFAKANNQALALAQGRYQMLLNSDTLVRPGALKALVGFMDQHPQAGGCGPRLLNGDGSLQPSCHPLLTPWREFWRLTLMDRLLPLATYRQEAWPTDQARRVEVIKGACLLLRSEALARVGVLDDRYFMYTEEMDLCLRIMQAGWTLHYVPMAQVVHFGEASSRQVAVDMYLQLYRSKIQFQRKFGGDRRARWFKVLLAMAYLPRWVLAMLMMPSGDKRRLIYTEMLRQLPSM